MLSITIMIICAITIVLLKLFLNINFKDIKQFNTRGSTELEKLPIKFPTDEEMCKAILKKFKNEDVPIKINPEYNSCLYTVINNTITIGKFKQDYMKVQTIAHECIHASQNKRILWSNFIVSNVYLLYFFTITVLSFFNKLPHTQIHLMILIFGSLIQYIIRYHLESEAMLKARYVAEGYLEENKLLEYDEKSILLKEYDEVNQISIPFMHFYMISMNLMKIIIFAFATLT